MITIDIQALVDRLEDLVDSARGVPLSTRIGMEESDLRNLIDQMRLSIPAEIARAREVTQQRDAILARAQEEASRVLADAKVRVEEERVMQEAREQAEQILSQAREQENELRIGATTYARDTLQALRKRLGEMCQQVDNGLERLDASDQETD